MEEVAVLAIIFIGIATIITIVIYFKTRHRERLALIKYDKDASVFKKTKGPGRGSLKLGLVALAGGVGLIIGSIIDGIFNSHSEIGTFSCLLIFGGMALIYYYRHFADKEEIENRSFENPYEEEDEMV